MVSCHEMMVLWHEMMISWHEMTILCKYVQPSFQVRARTVAGTFGSVEKHGGRDSPKEQVFPDPYNLIIIVYYLSRLIPFASNQTQHEMMISCHEMMVLWHEMMISCHEMTTLMDGWAWYPLNFY